MSFTHVDPFEDTERKCIILARSRAHGVSPTSIRSRILKDLFEQAQAHRVNGFTHVDPFEDTERTSPRGPCTSPVWVSPTSIRSRILKAV